MSQYVPHLGRSLRFAALALVAGFALAGCDTLGGLFGQGTARDEDKPAEYVERPVNLIYEDAWKRINNDDWINAAKQFDEVERQHPYSIWARRAMLMAAFCYYRANHYTEAISTADSYIQLHPGSREVAYAFYLKAISLYEQIVDVGRDQSNTEQALTALQDVVQRFPDTEYARDATLKIDLTLDHLAGKEMTVGRYYLRQGDYIGAINRFKVVVEQYQKTSQIAEALERLVEAYYAMGIYNEAQSAAAVLGANYPGSPWYQDAYQLLAKKNLRPLMDERSWLSKTFGRILF
ncbi:MAG: outer membrane protein assembly factor BamD [Alphaproteobacteria bacterium]|nr:outer membrane protein assembly factor BamD [Alphaproteobacteria bacterium]MBL6936799.1 outer membrane protein assembly factor BamD [Alphaproteobacteria bacterium]MBL7097568.1 outer membrane protein assembly factor BamD [Alphaproteobacteria bacterium]